MDVLHERLRASQRVLIFTGAGVSTGSGIPDFRGPNGIWKTRQPVLFGDFVRSEAARIEHWNQKLEGYEAFRNAKPNAAHRALVDLEQTGRMSALVTQNIDGLHQAAGNSRDMVIELHGTNREAQCIECSARSSIDAAMASFRQTHKSPKCDACGGALKTATISFGQAMPPMEMKRAFVAAERSDVVLSIGSSLEVYPAASVPERAKECRAFYAILNQGPTGHDSIADVRLDGDVVETLPALIEVIKTAG